MSGPRENVKSLNGEVVLKMRLMRPNWQLGEGPVGNRQGFVGRNWADVKSTEEFH